MPVQDYGVWKAWPVHYEFECDYEDRKSPHLSLYYHDQEGKMPGFNKNFRREHKHGPKPKEIPGLFRAAINIKSIDKDSRLAFWVNENLIEHPIVEMLANLKPGFHSVGGFGGGKGLDYIRSDLFNNKDGRVLPHDIAGPNNDIIEVLVPQVEKAIQEGAAVYLFGSRFDSGDGIHNVHMNQGNIKKFTKDDGVYQDGGLLIHYNNQWTGVFLAFASQSMHTDDKTGQTIIPEGYPRPVTWGNFLAPVLTENSVAIVEAYVNPPGEDKRPRGRRESVTLENLTKKEVSLSSWKFHNSAGQVEVLPRNAALKSMATGRFEVPHCPLSNKGDTITLLDEHGLKVDGVSYNGRQGKVEGRPIVFAH